MCPCTYFSMCYESQPRWIMYIRIWFAHGGAAELFVLAYGCVGVDVSCGGLVDECLLSCMWRSAPVSSNQVMSESSGSAASFVSCKGQLSCVFILKLIWMMLPGACQPLAHQWRWCEDINTVQWKHLIFQAKKWSDCDISCLRVDSFRYSLSSERKLNLHKWINA